MSRSQSPVEEHRTRLPRKAPRQERGRQSADAVLEGTVRVLDRSGADALTIREISRASGVSLGSIYQYFASKEDILIAVFERHVGKVLSALEELLSHEDPEAQLRPLTERLAHAILAAHETHQRALTEIVARMPGDARSSIIDAAADRMAASVAQHWHGAAQNVRFADIALATVIVEAVVHGPMVLGPTPRDDLAHKLARLIESCLDSDQPRQETAH